MSKKRTSQNEWTGFFKIAASFFLAACFSQGALSAATEAKDFEVKETALYKDIFDQNLFNEGVNQLDFGRWTRKIFHKKIPSANVNVFDEVPDSTFFTNRHNRTRLSLEELERGYREDGGADLAQPMTVVASERRGIYPGFIVKDAKGDRYLLRFDLEGGFEMITAAEVIASRFYYALGYNVPQYTVLRFRREQMKLGPDSPTYDDTGFLKNMTPKLLDEYLALIPTAKDGSFRASASKILSGERLGNFSFWSRRKEDVNDPVNHRDRREIRALTVFSAWLNNYDVRESNTLDMRVTEGGQIFLKHYLVDFTNTLGASTEGPKPPMFGYEYLMDYGEGFKSFLALGFREKPWQKKWRLAGEKASVSPAVGYLSNDLFDPAKYKTQLPYEAFRLVTLADGFWAAKIMMSFSNDDIRAMVKAGEYSRAEDAEVIAQILIERRDMIAKYWFEKTAPLDGFEISGNKLSFKDLAVEHGFAPKGGTIYYVKAVPPGAKEKKAAKIEINDPFIVVQPEWISGNEETKILIEVLRPGSKKTSPPITVRLNASGVQGIRHAD